MMITIAVKVMITIVRGEREGGGQRVMIEIIICGNDDNDGRPISENVFNSGRPLRAKSSLLEM